MDTVLQQIVNGLTVGAVYALIALGYTMVYGIIELINFAHGEIYMLGAYLGIIIIGALVGAGVGGPPALLLVLAVGGAMAVCAAYGVTLERVAYRPLRNAPRLAPLISALGMSIVLQNFVMLSQGTKDKVFPGIVPMDTIEIFSAHVSYLQVVILVTSVVLMVGLHLFIQRTRLGMAMRATAQDRVMASLVGVDPNRIIATTFAIGSLLAAAAGVMIAMHYTLVSFTIGYLAGMKAFTAAVLGGIGNLPGAMLGGLLLGLVESFGGGYISSEYKDAFSFGILILVILVRPQGLLGERVPEKY